MHTFDNESTLKHTGTPLALSVLHSQRGPGNQANAPQRGESNMTFPTDWPQTQLGDAIALEAWFQSSQGGLQAFARSFELQVGAGRTRHAWLAWLQRLATELGVGDFRNLA